jgi:hypothetical protein
VFTPQHDNPPSLRQGDIISNVFFPLTRPALLKYLGTYASGSDTKIRTEPLIEQPTDARKSYSLSICHGVVAHGAVLSQCCDLDKKHPKTSFSLCRLVPVNHSRVKNLEALINNIDPYGEENPHFQFFYLGSINGLDGEYMADYALLTSFGWNDYDLILKKKIHQLDDLNRNKFRVKAGAAFGRPADEDVGSGLANPYEPVVPSNRGLLDRVRAFFGRR